ncbi:MAG: GNAT family N-acetyltransferase, partial [Pseudomonadota bacterium]
QFYVVAGARGTGLAQALMVDAEARIRAGGHETAWLGCAIGNDRARRFYEKCGWVCARTEVVDLDTSSGPFPLELWRLEKALDRLAQAG